jgi:hypothetical protein
LIRDNSLIVSMQVNNYLETQDSILLVIRSEDMHKESHDISCIFFIVVIEG